MLIRTINRFVHKGLYLNLYKMMTYLLKEILREQSKSKTIQTTCDTPFALSICVIMFRRSTIKRRTTDDFRSSVEGGPPSNASNVFFQEIRLKQHKENVNTGTWKLGNPEYFLIEKKPSRSSPEYSSFDGHFQMRQIINLSPTLNEHTDKDFRNENFIVNMACLKGGLPVSPYMDQQRIQTFREGAGVGVRCPVSKNMGSKNQRKPSPGSATADYPT